MNASSAHPVARRPDDERNGLVELLTGLVEGNLARDPGRVRLLRPARVGIVARDAGVSATMILGPGVVRVRTGLDPPLDVRVSALTGDLLDLAAVPLRAGMPDPLDRAGRRLLGAVLLGRVRITGLALHLPTVARLMRLLSSR